MSPSYNFGLGRVRLQFSRVALGGLVAAGVVVVIVVGALFVESRGNSTPAAATQPASFTWKQAQGLPSDARVMAAHGSTVVAIEGGAGDPMPVQVMWLSTDGGYSWQEAGDLPDYDKVMQIGDATWAAGEFVIVGGGDLSSTVWLSQDGRTWQDFQVDLPRAWRVAGTSSTVVVGTVRTLGGQSGQTTRNDPLLAASGEGKVWQNVTIDGFGVDIEGIKAGPGVIVATAGWAQPGQLPLACTTDGTHWQQARIDATLPSEVLWDLMSASIPSGGSGPWYVGDHWVAELEQPRAGDGPTLLNPMPAYLVTSQDGCSWHLEKAMSLTLGAAAQASAPSDSGQKFIAFAVSLDGYLVGCLRNSDALCKSTDGLNWSQLPAGASAPVMPTSSMFATDGRLLIQESGEVWVGAPTPGT